MIAPLLFLIVSQAAGDLPEAADVFRQRQEDLVLLAGKLGSLHRLNQVCPGYGRAAMFRDRMKELIDGERPPRSTREAMIDSFNDNYREMSRMHFTCSRRAEYDLEEEAAVALSIADRLAAPLG